VSRCGGRGGRWRGLSRVGEGVEVEGGGSAVDVDGVGNGVGKWKIGRRWCVWAERFGWIEVARQQSGEQGRD
jgi:hypothetical protein